VRHCKCPLEDNNNTQLPRMNAGLPGISFPCLLYRLGEGKGMRSRPLVPK
jgi:hypothetical protein